MEKRSAIESVASCDYWKVRIAAAAVVVVGVSSSFEGAGYWFWGESNRLERAT